MILLNQLLKDFKTKITLGFVLLMCMICTSNKVLAQELNCTVQINYQQVTSVNADVFEKMQTAMWEFVNNQRWTKDQFKPEEKIDCQFFFNIDEALSNTQFKATVSVQATRPVYGTSYETTILNFIDKNVIFEYQEDQPMFFVENAYTSNLTSVLAFYSYLVIGFDYETFSKRGGEKYFDKANEISSYAQQAPPPYKTGWSTESKNSRYELIQDLTNTQFSPFRSYLYTYHRMGLDSFDQNQVKMRADVLKSLNEFRTIFQIKQQSMLLRIFFMSKMQELINIFSKATSTEKQKFLKFVEEMDSGNLSRYQKINKI